MRRSIAIVERSRCWAPGHHAKHSFGIRRPHAAAQQVHKTTSSLQRLTATSPCSHQGLNLEKVFLPGLLGRFRVLSPPGLGYRKKNRTCSLEHVHVGGTHVLEDTVVAASHLKAVAEPQLLQFNKDSPRRGDGACKQQVGVLADQLTSVY